MFKYTIFFLFVNCFLISSLKAQNNGTSRHTSSTFIRFELPVSFMNLPTEEQMIISPYSFTNSNFRINMKMGFMMDFQFENGFGVLTGIRFLKQRDTEKYILDRYRNNTFEILNKNLKESIWSLEYTIGGYYLKELNGKHSLSFDLIWQYSASWLTDNIIVHGEKNPSIHVPIVEYNNYQLEEYMLGLGMNHFVNINSRLQFYSGLQVLFPFQSDFNYRMTYFDDYYIYKDIKGGDLPEEEVFDLHHRFRFNLMLGIRAKLY